MRMRMGFRLYATMPMPMHKQSKACCKQFVGSFRSSFSRLLLVRVLCVCVRNGSLFGLPLSLLMGFVCALFISRFCLRFVCSHLLKIIIWKICVYVCVDCLVCASGPCRYMVLFVRTFPLSVLLCMFMFICSDFVRFLYLQNHFVAFACVGISLFTHNKKSTCEYMV